MELLWLKSLSKYHTDDCSCMSRSRTNQLSISEAEVLGSMRSQNARMIYRADALELVNHLRHCSAMSHAPFHHSDLEQGSVANLGSQSVTPQLGGDLVHRILFDAAAVAVVTPDSAGRIAVVALRHLGCETGQAFAAELRDGHVILSPTDQESPMVLREKSRIKLATSVSWHLELCSGESLICLVDEDCRVLLAPVRRFFGSRLKPTGQQRVEPPRCESAFVDNQRRWRASGQGQDQFRVVSRATMQTRKICCVSRGRGLHQSDEQ